MKPGDGRGVGICLGASGAVIALARSQPSRVVAIASVSWPHGLWQHPGPERGPAAAARRMLGRARRQLALPRWHPVSVVIGPSLWGHMPEEVLAASAELLARAGLSQAWVTPPGRADFLRRQVAIGPGALGAAAAGEEASLAIGAALASLTPPPTHTALPHTPTAMPPAPPAAMPPEAMPPPPEAMPPAPSAPAEAMPPAPPAAMPPWAMPPAARAPMPPVAAPAVPTAEMPAVAHGVVPAVPSAFPPAVPPAAMPPAAMPAVPPVAESGVPLAAMPAVPPVAVSTAEMPVVAPGMAPGVGPGAMSMVAPVPISNAGWALQRIGDVEGPVEYAMMGERE